MTDRGFLASIKRLLAKGRPTGPQPGELWYVDNVIAGVVDTSTENHPAIVLVTNGISGVVLIGTSGPALYKSDGFAVHPTDVITNSGEQGLRCSTYFGRGRSTIPTTTPGNFVARIGRVAPDLLARLKKHSELRPTPRPGNEPLTPRVSKDKV